MIPYLSKGAVKVIHAAIDRLFDRAKARTLGPWSVDKRISFEIKPQEEFTFPGLYAASAIAAGGRFPDKEILKGLLGIAESYIESQRDNVKGQVVNAIDSFMKDAEIKGVITNVPTVLGGELAKVWEKATGDMRKIIDSEANNIKNAGSLDSILETAASAGIDDPYVFFIIVRDGKCCPECVKLHMLGDGITPKIWYLSELTHGYHKKGDDFPSLGGEHPHCFTGSQLLHTDKGLVSFEELYKSGESVNVVVDNRVEYGHMAPGVKGPCFMEGNSGSRVLSATNVYSTGVQECLEIRLKTGQKVEVTTGHEMWACSAEPIKVRADAVKVGSNVPLLNGGWGEVVSIRSIGEHKTYCLTEPMTNTITVNGIVTGNCRCVLAYLPKGYGFKNGYIHFIDVDHNELENQRG